VKKIVILVLIAVAAYWGYKHYGSILSGPGAFDAQGNPTVVLFTADGCGQLCNDVAGELRSRGITFEEVNVATEEGRSRIGKFGVNQLPFMVVGRRTVIGYDLPAVGAALAEAKGMEVLTPAEQAVMRNHFDEQGKPRVVVYGTETCPYCKHMRAHLEERKTVYQFVDVTGFGSGRSDFEVLRGRGYPLVFVGYRRIDGDNEAAVDQAVKELL
jgi:glutaredoxin